VKYAFVRAHQTEFSISRMCHMLRVSRSGYYDWYDRGPSARAKDDKELLEQIGKIHRDNKQAYGGIKTWQALSQAGIRCGKHRVARLRRAAGIEAQRKRKFRLAYRSRQNTQAVANLLKWPFAASQPDRIWMADVTFIATRAGWLYLAVLIDLYSRLIIGWSMTDRPNQDLVNGALRMAIEQRKPKPGTIHHSDQGVVYNAGTYIEMLRGHDMIRSMSGKGNCYDNAVVESFFSSLKNELVHHRDYHTRDQARTDIFEYIEIFYNRRRLHQSLNYQTPMAYESMKLSTN
jgi:putative transposase